MCALAVMTCGVAAAQALGLHVLGWLACVLVGWLAWQSKKVRWYGLTLLWCPGGIGFLLTFADPLTRAWGAVLGMLGFYAIWSVLEAREEDSRLGWVGALLLTIWQPSSFALLGMTFLAVQSTARWRSQLAPTRGLKFQSSPRLWLGLAVLALLVFGLSLWLPSPAAWRVQDILVPNLDLNLPKAGFSSLQADNTPRFQRPEGRGFDIRILVWGLIVLGAITYLQARFRASRGQHLSQEGLARDKPVLKKSKAKFDLLLPFVVATVTVLMIVFWTIKNFSSRNIPIQLPVVPNLAAALLVLGFGLSLLSVVLWLRKLLQKSFKPIKPSEFLKPKPGELELPENRVRAAYALWLRLLTDLELKRDQTETPFEFSGRVHVHHPNLRDATFILTSAYERTRYGSSVLEIDAVQAEESLEIWRSSIADQRKNSATSLTLNLPTPLLD